MTDAEPVIHDHTWSAWGHAVLSLRPPDADGHRAACIITTPAPKDGDVVLLPSARNHDDGTPGVLQYRVVGDVRTPINPGDQHFLDLAFMEAETNAADGRDPRTIDTRSTR